MNRVIVTIRMSKRTAIIISAVLAAIGLIGDMALMVVGVLGTAKWFMYGYYNSFGAECIGNIFLYVILTVCFAMFLALLVLPAPKAIRKGYQKMISEEEKHE